MRSIDQFQFYKLGQSVHPLEGIRGDQKLSDVWYLLWNAGNWLDFVRGNNLVGLSVSLGAVQKLASLCRRLAAADIAKLDSANWENTLNSIDANFVMQLPQAVKEFETVFAAELQVVPSYVVNRKGIYATDLLIEHAEQAFDEPSRKAIPDSALKDFRDAGRCLAFELPTAAAFHVMRTAEGVLRKYHALIKNLPIGQKSPDWAVCVNEIKASGGNAKVTAILDQIRNLHRNPTMHPDEFLTVGESLALFDVAKSAIAAMADEIIMLEAQPAVAAASARAAAATPPPPPLSKVEA